MFYPYLRNYCQLMDSGLGKVILLQNKVPEKLFVFQ